MHKVASIPIKEQLLFCLDYLEEIKLKGFNSYKGTIVIHTRSKQKNRKR